MTGDQYMQCEAMMHIEQVLGLLEISGMPTTDDGLVYLEEYGRREEIKRRLWAALYLIQAMNGGNMPSNWNKVMNEAREYDAKSEAAEVIALIKQGHFSKKD